MRSLGAALVLLGLTACDPGEPRDPGAGDRPDAARPGAPAPALETLTLEGDSPALSDLHGAVALVNVWATWCAPCRKEVPELQSLHETYADAGLRVIGVSVDSRSAEAEIRRFMETFGITYDIWWDPDQTAVTAFHATGVPLTVLIDATGHVAWRHLGPFRRGDPELRHALETALAAPTPARRPATPAGR